MGFVDRFPRWLQRVYFRFARPLLFRRYRYLNQEILKNRVSRILEIGVWTGMQAEQMILSAKKVSSSVEYYGFDLFEDMSSASFEQEAAKKPAKMDVVLNALKKTGAKVELFRGDTNRTLAAAKHLPKMGLVYIDGGHSLETIRNDWKNVKPFLGKDTVVIFDDYWNSLEAGAKPLVDGLDRKKYEVEVLPIKDKGSYNSRPVSIQFAKVRLKQ